MTTPVELVSTLMTWQAFSPNALPIASATRFASWSLATNAANVLPLPEMNALSAPFVGIRERFIDSTKECLTVGLMNTILHGEAKILVLFLKKAGNQKSHS